MLRTARCQLPRPGSAALILAFATLCPRSYGQTPQLGTHDESTDGRVQDIAGPTQVYDADAQRLWIANGRVRWAIAPYNHTRVFGEDKTFNSSSIPLDFESVLALEFDELQNRLVSLTDGGVYVESPPSGPVPSTFFDLHAAVGTFIPLALPSESVVDVKLWVDSVANPGATEIFVLTSKRIITLRFSPMPVPSIEYRGQTPELFSSVPLATFLAPQPPDAVFDFLAVGFLNKMRIQEDANGRVMAYVLVEALGFPFVAGRPKPRIVMACDLNAPNFTLPTFNAATLPAVRYVYWNPIPVDTVGSYTRDHEAADLAPVAVGSERLVYAACGKDKQVQRLTVTNCFTSTTGITADPVAWVTLDSSSPVRNILIDRNDPNCLFAVTPRAFWVYKPGNPPGSTTHVPQGQTEEYEELFDRGCPRDMIHVTLPWSEPSLETVWTVSHGPVDHVAKAMNVTYDQVWVQAYAQYYALSASDGGVMIGSNVYLPNFGGVVRYENTGSASAPTWRADPDSFRPAESIFDLGDVTGTEHIDRGTIPLQGIFAERLLVVGQSGVCDDYRVNANSGRPDPLARAEPDPALLPTSWGYTPDGPFYANDVAFFDGNPASQFEGKYAFVDITQYAVAPDGYDAKEAGLIAYRWRQDVQSWEHVASAIGTPFLHDCNPFPLTTTIALAEVLPAAEPLITTPRRYAFVGTRDGFFSVDFTNLLLNPPVTPLMSVVSIVNPPPPMGIDCSEVFGIARSGDRLFCWPNRQADVRVYQWNQANGVINPSPVASLALPPPFAGALCYRARFDPDPTAINGAGTIYFATQAYLVQVHYAGAPSHTLAVTGHWKSDYEGALQDCRPYTLPGTGGATGVLVVKDRESFAFVKKQ